jgi:hypothetical protein
MHNPGASRRGIARTRVSLFGDFEHSICELLDHLGVDVAGSGAF